MPKRKLVVTEQVEVKKQHTRPCGDCPWRRDAVRGWLGGHKPMDWILSAIGDGIIHCHTKKGDPHPQCAGAATFRTNVSKRPRDRSALLLPKDTKRVFGDPKEFIEYHSNHIGKIGEVHDGS